MGILSDLWDAAGILFDNIFDFICSSLEALLDAAFWVFDHLLDLATDIYSWIEANEVGIKQAGGSEISEILGSYFGTFMASEIAAGRAPQHKNWKAMKQQLDNSIISVAQNKGGKIVADAVHSAQNGISQETIKEFGGSSTVIIDI